MQSLRIINHTSQQEATWDKTLKILKETFGSDDAGTHIAIMANKYMSDHNLDTRCGYAYAIDLANKKLNGPVLDDVEYHEIIKAQKIMDELTNV